MARILKILAVNEINVHASMLRSAVKRALSDNDIEADVAFGDVADAVRSDADMLFCGIELNTLLKNISSVPVIIIDNFLGLDEIAEKALPVVNELINSDINLIRNSKERWFYTP